MKSFLCSVFLIALPASLQAQVIPGRWEMVEALTPSTEIVVKLKSGDRIEGAFRSAGVDVVRLTNPGGKELSVPKSEVRSIETTAKAGLGRRKYVLIGTAVGSLAAVLGMIGYAESVTASGSIWGEDTAGYLIGAGLVGGGIGALGGVAASAIVSKNKVIYRAR